MAADLFARLALQCRRIFLRDHVVDVQIGAHDFEKKQTQRVVFNVELFVPYADSTPRSDKLAEVVDYDFVRAVVAHRVSDGHVELQETLCDDLVEALMAHPCVVAVRLSTCKPDVYPDCAGVGVEVFRVRETFI
jgi:7,8-dihydroneopterin aldolase/epimerase/oxygenase